MNTNDEILDLLIKRDLLLQRVGNGLSKEVALYYTDLIKQAINTIKDYDEITIVKMNKLIKEINSRIEFNYEEQLANKFQELANIEAAYVPKAINGLIGIDIVDKLLPEPLIERILRNSILPDGHFIGEAFTKLDNRLKDTFQSQIRLGVLNGSTNNEIVKGLKPILDNFTKNNVTTLVKTSLNTFTNDVRFGIYKENESVFKGYQHQSVIDNRTSLICSVRDNLAWDLDLKPIGHNLPFKKPSLHYNCRSIILPILKSFKEMGIDLEEVSGLTRSSIDGELARSTSFSDWFDKKPKAFQEEYLGTGRYELYKQGKITLSDLVSQNGRVLTLKELKEKYS